MQVLWRYEYLHPLSLPPSASPHSTPSPQVHFGAGAYICGEETALIESLEGKQVCGGGGGASEVQRGALKPCAQAPPHEPRSIPHTPAQPIRLSTIRP